ncbi:TonB-dependent receptor [Haematobacter massiliensis]|uniref:TonB-dependent receptor n=1 Tax=Haematobacter massiliensis TaxID=195105 RepID=A0A086Y808_9RHOB|nr:TonB-dependent receptor [Haematobacter massiliensis]KFI30408.1 TonB-dependent receptor [Haematobacter massiliensis]OWJ70449.1 TonB-dependent receptor [Haematobacter massiliensis]OWJ87409.1 TonB-dependent receptor [Haematobacter massiliensis]QBJ24863.1 TonB-dependent receptor [Haematobacter massiliensis]
MTFTGIRTITILAALTPVAAHAQAGSPVLLDSIVLSGGLSPISAAAYGRAFSVVTAAEIEERGIRTVQDALRGVPGVSVTSAGPSFTQVRIRGAEASHTLILIDGVPATGGNDEYILTGLETANVERIEVLRGPQSVYFGSNASAGVINIITRRGEIGTHYGGAVEVGNGYAASGWVTQRTERGGLSFNVSKRDDHGYNPAFTGSEKDGTDRRTIGLTGDWQATEALKLGFTLRYSRENYGYDATNYAATGYRDYLIDDPHLTGERKEFTGSLWAEYEMLEGRLVNRLEFQNSIFRQGTTEAAETRGETRALKYRLSYGLDGQPIAEARHLLNLMLERSEDENDTARDYDRANNSVAVEYRGSFDTGVDVQAGLRHDDFDTFEDFTSWNIGLSWQIPDSAFRVHASAGRGLVKPSYYELFANDGYTLGNPALKPERNTGYDIGVEAEVLNGRGLIDVTYFNEKMADEITYVFGGAPDGRATYINQRGKSPREGVEIAGRFAATDALNLSVSYTYLDAKNPDGTVEVRRPRHELGLEATQQVLNGRGSLTADIRYVSGNYDTQYWGFYDTKELGNYTLVNLSAGYDLTENLRATARVVNLFDKEYMEVWGFRSQGRQAYLGLEAKW